jgi:WD40 repeat protein
MKPNPELEESAFATRMLEPETIDGQRYEVVEVRNPVAVLSGDSPRLANEIGISVRQGVARYYIGEDRRIHRIMADFTLRAKPENALKLPESSVLHVEITGIKIEKGQVPIRRPQTAPPLRTLRLPDDGFRTTTLLTPDGKYVIGGLRDGGIAIYDTVSGSEVRTLEGHLSPIARLHVSGDGTLLASQSEDGVVALWDIALGKLLRTHRHESAPSALALSPDGAWLAVNLAGKGVLVRRVRSGETAATLPELLVARLVFSPDSQTLATITTDGVVKLWDSAAWKPGREFEALREPTQPVSAAAFSPDGKLLAVGGAKGAVEVWETETGKRLQKLAGAPTEIVGLAFSPEGKWLAVADADRIRDFIGAPETVSTAVTLWSTQTWTPTHTVGVEQGGDCKGVLVLRDGRTLVKFAAANHAFAFWAIPEGK